jgi:hypothetical protein
LQLQLPQVRNFTKRYQVHSIGCNGIWIMVRDIFIGTRLNGIKSLETPAQQPPCTAFTMALVQKTTGIPRLTTLFYILQIQHAGAQLGCMGRRTLRPSPKGATGCLQHSLLTRHTLVNAEQCTMFPPISGPKSTKCAALGVARRGFKLAPALAEQPQQTDRQKDQSNRPVPQRAIHLKRC